MRFLNGTLLVSVWCYDDLCRAMKFNVPPDIFTVICSHAVIADFAAAHMGNYSNIFLFFLTWVFIFVCWCLFFSIIIFAFFKFMSMSAS